MAQKPLKTLIIAITILSLCFTSSIAEEKYTAMNVLKNLVEEH